MSVIGLVGGMSKRECCRIGPNWPRGSIAKGSGIIFWARMLPSTVLPMVVIPVVRLVLLLHPSFFFSYFCRCESALVVKILVKLLEVGSKIGARRGATDDSEYYGHCEKK